MSYAQAKNWVERGLADWTSYRSIVVRRTGARVAWPPERYCGCGSRIGSDACDLCGMGRADW